jgi:hypothetical protein
MKDERKEKKGWCAAFREALERLPAEVGRQQGATELKSRLALDGITHAEYCAACLEEAETFWASRELLAELRETREEAPWFARQVMVKIASREAEARRERMEWMGAVAKSASRWTWVSAVAVLVASTWVYDGRLKAPTGPADAVPQYLFDSSGSTVSVDDALANLPDKTP